jgi:hypothetical protein
MVEPAFYTPLGGHVFASSEHTTGSWSAEAQHFGPPSALLARALEEIATPGGGSIGRVTVEILGPLPVDELTVRSHVARPGRSVRLLHAELTCRGRTAATAAGWQLATSDTSRVAAGAGAPLPGPKEFGEATAVEGWGGGYMAAVEWRFVRGGFDTLGPATVWMRQRLPLVAGEDPSPLQRVMVVADTGNGASAWLDPREWYFINSELTVHTHRELSGEWVGLDAHTVLGPSGVGTARSTLHDTVGPVGHGAQALLVRPR